MHYSHKNGFREVLLVDPWPSTPDYNNSLLTALRQTGVNASLWTADYHHRPAEPESAVEGRQYRFLRLSRKLRRKFKGRRLLTYIAYLVALPEYCFDWFQLLAYVGKHRPLVHIQWILHPVVDVLPILILRALRIKLVWTAHNVLPHDRDTQANRILYGIMYRLANRVILHSRKNIEEMEAMFSPGSKLCHVRFGLPFMDVSPVPRDNARKTLGWASNEEVIVFQGRVQPYKGLDILLESLASVRPVANLRLVLCVDWCGAYNEFDRMLGIIRKMYKVEVHTGVTSIRKFRDLACGADVWILPYRSASASFTGMVALRYCTPMIVTNTGALPEMIGENLAEWVVPAGDAVALREAIQRFFNPTPQERSQIKEMLTEQRKLFTWEAIGMKTAHIYQELCNG